MPVVLLHHPATCGRSPSMSIVKQIDTKSVHRICSGQVVADLGASVKVPRAPPHSAALSQLPSRLVLTECRSRRGPVTTIHPQLCRRLLLKHRLGCDSTAVVKGAKLFQRPPCRAHAARLQRIPTMGITSISR